MQSLIIVGGTSKEREERAGKIIRDLKVSSFDQILVTGETSVGIEQIRTLKNRLSLRPYNSPSKAAFIHPGELLTIEAQNALLKTLEETGENSIVIITAPQPESLLPTVISRCRIIRLPSRLEINFNEEETISIIQNLSSIIQSGVGERLSLASFLPKTREEIKAWLEKSLFFWREVLLLKEGRINQQYANMLIGCKEIETLTTLQVIMIIKQTIITINFVSQNVNPRLALEVLLLDLPRLKD